MINRSDIRFGNLVYSSMSPDAPVKINSIDTNICKAGEYLEDYSNLFGIPLTIEILLNCEFYPGGYHENYYYHNILHPHIVVYDDCFVLDVSDEITISESFKYIHQLQNLFYTLTGKELEIKDKTL